MASVQSTMSPLEPHVQCLPWVQQGCSQQNHLVTAPQKLQNPISLSGHLWGHQEGCSGRNASAFKQHSLQPFVNISISKSNLQDSLSRNLNTAITTVRCDLLLNIKDTPITEQTPATFLPICFTQTHQATDPSNH